MNPLWECVPYTSGRGIEVNSESRFFDHFMRADVNCIKGQSLDFVFAREVKRIDPQWWRVIKFGGYLVVLGEDVSDQMDHYEQLRHDECDGELFQVFQKKERGGRVLHVVPKPAKTAAVVRYGGYGDAIQASSVFPGLKAQGFHITFYGQPQTIEVLKHDPHVDRFIRQDRNQVPNEALMQFWLYESKKYDRWINLSESVESTLLVPADQARFYWEKEARHAVCNVNYLELVHQIAGVPFRPAAAFYPTEAERLWALRQRDKEDGPFIVYSMAGSSIHKLWPHMDALIARFLLASSSAKVVLVGDQLDSFLMAPWVNESRVWRKAGEWSIRQAMAFSQVADLVIGTETGLLNAMGLEAVPKIVFLSHSTAENLTKHWRNTHAIAPPATVGCYPCHRHITEWAHCNRNEEHGTAACAAAISVDWVWLAVEDALKEMRDARFLHAA